MIHSKITAFVLSSGRSKYLEEALKSISRNSRKPDCVVVVHDATNPIIVPSDVRIIRTTPPESGHWVFAFRRALQFLNESSQMFFVMHDDDILMPNYIEALSSYLINNKELQAVSCSLESINAEGKRISGPEFLFKTKCFPNKDSVLEHYVTSCIPFPAAFYRNLGFSYASLIQPQFGSFADGLFFAELARFGAIEIIPDAFYQYRRHAGQMSGLQSTKAEFQFLREILERITPAKRQKLRLIAEERATLASLNDIHKSKNLDALYEMYRAGLRVSWRAALRKPKLLARAIIQISSHPSGWKRTEASAILDRATFSQKGLSIICFSKDRPMQLQSLLESLKMNTPKDNKIQVIYRATSEPMTKAYLHLIRKNLKIRFLKDGDFKKQVKQAVDKAKAYVAFATDDSLILQPFALEAVLEDPRVICFSLRLGLNTKRCYTSHRDMPLPKMFCNEKCILWSWKKAKDDFAYPMSLDGHIFRKNDLIRWLQGIEYQNPNELEDALSKIIQKTKVVQKVPQWMAAYRSSRYVSIPINRVQTRFENRAGNKPRYGTKVLLRRFSRGDRIDINKTICVPPDSPHQEYNLRFVSNRDRK